MKISLNELRGMQMGLDVILAEKLTCKPGYWLARFLNKVQSEMKAMEKTRLMLIEKYAKKDKDGKPMFMKDKDGKPMNQYDFGKKGLEDFNKEYEILSKEEIEIDFKPIKLSDIDVEVCEKCGRKKLVIKPIVWVQLGKLIEE